MTGTRPNIADHEWRLIRDTHREGATQMALEEVAARTALEDDLRTVRVYGWAPSTLSLGYGQDADTVDWAYCEREGIDVTRRQTGGGGIYHDSWADISYTIVAPAAEVPGDLMACYRLFCEPILGALEAMGIDADFAPTEQDAIYHPSCYLRDINPVHDIVAPVGDCGEVGAEAQALKISGNAQYRTRDAVIQHGSISYDLEAARHVGVFADDISPAVFEKRVTGIRQQSGISRGSAVETLADTLGEWCDAEAGEWTGEELEAAAELADQKYGNEAWVRDRDQERAQ